MRGGGRVVWATAVWLLVACMGAGSAGRLDAQESRVITFREAVEMALEANTDLLRARADLDLRGTIETRERFDFLPQISVSGRGSRSFGRSFSQEEGAILSETNDIFDAGLSASMNVFDGLENIASLRQASVEEGASRLRLERTREDVLFEVVAGFNDLVLARELTLVRGDELAAAEEMLEQVERLVELGRQPASDLYQQEAIHAEAEVALVEAERQVALAETALMQVLELDPLRTYEFETPALPEVEEDVPEYHLDALLETAFANRADLGATEAGLTASRHGVTAARSGYWPSLSVSFNYGSNWSGNSLQPVPGTGSDPTTVTIVPDDGSSPFTMEVPGTGVPPTFRRPDFVEQLDARRGGSFSLSLSVPVFDGLQTRTAVAQAEVARLNARYDVQDQRQQVALQVRQALLDYRSAAAQRLASARRLEAAQRGWEAAERRYELGAATFVEVAQARATLTSARSAATQARFNVLLARSLIAYYTGTLNPDDPIPAVYDEGPR